MDKHNYRNRLVPGVVALLSLAAALRSQPAASERDIHAVLEAQQAAWNRGDVDGFMSGYADSDGTTFVGKTITRGYKGVLDSYHRRYPTKAAMGQLAFSDLEVKLLGAEYASVIGKWHLTRSADAGGDVGGIFTLLFRKTTGGWKIILDHTS